MGLCYPGKGKSGDLPSRSECAPIWHSSIIPLLKQIKLTLLIGKYARDYDLPDYGKTLTENVQRWEEFLPSLILLPHPSPRNRYWFAKNRWFEKDVIPSLREKLNAFI